MAMLDDVITYLEMREPPKTPRLPAPAGIKLALMRAEAPTVSFYRYLYETVGTPWLWYERRLMEDARLISGVLLYPTGRAVGQFGFSNAADVMSICALS